MKKIFKFVFICFMFVFNLCVCLAFENDIKGSTGWGINDLDIFESVDSSNSLGIVPVGSPFLILEESGNYWKIKYNDIVGYVRHDYCMINLPDVIPSIKYDITNAYSSIFKSAGKDIPDITGVQLYSVGKVMNYKIGREEYIVPSLYSTAKMIYKAQVAALNDGYSLLIYDSYRPRSVDSLVTQRLTALNNSDTEVYNAINNNGWSKGWFVAESLSNHNVAAAIDVSLVVLSTGNEGNMPSVMHELSTAAVKYSSPYSNNYSSGMANSIDGQNLAHYMMSVGGMQDLKSEWWHYLDQDGYDRARAYGHAPNGCDFQVTSIVSEPDFSFDIVSNKFTVNNDNSFIYTGTDVDIFDIMSNIDIVGSDSESLTKSIDNGKLKVLYLDRVLREYDIINYSSSLFDLSKSYLVGNYDDISSNIILNGIDMNLNMVNNKIELRRGDVLLNSYDIINYTSESYDLSGSSIKVNDSDISSFLSKFNCVGCNIYVYDGTNSLTEGLFHDNYSLNIMYGSTLIKSFSLTYPVSGVSLNTHSVSINLGDDYQLFSTVNPLNADNKGVSYSSSNPNVVSVNDSGYVGTNGVGEADIIVTTLEGGFTDTCHVIVNSIPTYTVTFKDGDSFYTNKYAEGVSIVFKSDLEKAGYSLVGWSYDGSVYTFNDNLLMPNKDIVLTAIWEKKIPDINNYVVSGEYLNGVSLDTNVVDFNLGIDSIYDVKITNNKGVLKTSGLVSTGDYVKIYLDNSLVSEYQFVVKGDINGDGRNNAHDISRLYKHIRGRISMDECYIRAADVNGDTKANAHDISKMYKYIRGRISHL